MNTRYLYVMGAGSGAGKSTICLGILAQLLAAGVDPQQLAYIKPVTQCIAQQPVARFCERQGIACVDIGALVFRKGFSKDFIAGITPPTAVLMAEVLASIADVAKDKALVIIDGVGHPAVGSVVGVSNVDVALALPCKVLFVGKPGIGNALDNTVLCVTYMQAKGLAGIGVLYNKIPLEAFEAIKQLVTQRFPTLLPEVALLGFVAQAEAITALQDKTGDDYTQWFSQYIDPELLLGEWLKLPGYVH